MKYVPIFAGLFVVCFGCSSVGRVSKSTFVESQVIGTWVDRDGGNASLIFSSDGSGQISTGYQSAAMQWRIDYPFIHFTVANGKGFTSSIRGFDFNSSPPTMTIQQDLEQPITIVKR